MTLSLARFTSVTVLARLSCFVCEGKSAPLDHNTQALLNNNKQSEVIHNVIRCKII